MKKLFISIVAVGMAMTASAQQTDKQMATLQHGDKTTVYYGIDAFVSAYNAAADTLDVITLSSGEFNVPSTISKSIAVYGAGFERDTITGTDRTYLNKQVILVPDNMVDETGQTVKAARHVNGVCLEGLYINGIIWLQSNSATPIHNLIISKCQFNTIQFDVSSYNCTIKQSVFNQTASYERHTENMLFSNCHIRGYIYSFEASSTVVIDHCVIRNADGGIGGEYTYKNSILYMFPRSGYTANNCVFVGSGTPIQDINGNWTGVSNDDLWAAEGEDGSYSEKKDFALKYPERYVGNDGTEIGLHGGIYAWNKTPCIPRITECTIDTENASNGTIKVSIKAEAQTKE